MQPHSNRSGQSLLTYRVIKEFVIRGVLYPVGAIRMWTEEERNLVVDELREPKAMYEGDPCTPIEFSNHFELVVWR